jgi:pyruvate dehydrogenase E2 component (dihydrolipoamide acetyltransferase)
MAHEFRLPDIGEGLAEAEIVRWLVPVGGRVEQDQPVVEVETDKAVVEIPSPYAGVVLAHGAGEGETVEVGAVLVVIGEEGEAVEAVAPVEAVEPVAEEPRPIVGTLDEAAIELAPAAAVSAAAGTPKALPVVRKLAREMGVDLAAVPGSGPDGRITREDVLAAARPAGRHAPAVPPPSPAPPAGDERRPLSRLRRTIAANMSRSWAEIPHVTTFDEVDGSRLLAVRRALEARHATKVPLDTLLVKAVMPALRAFPDFNATLDGDDLVVHGDLDLGVAVDTPDGLLVVVVRSADRLGVVELATEIGRLAEGARRRSLEPGELTGQTFTVSNIGAVGGGHGTPIVPPGTTAILSVGRAVERPVARDGRVEIAPIVPVSLSYDHRVIDGGMGRRFMAMVLENLAEPALFLAA